MASDPVCQKQVDETNPPGGKVRFWGKLFFFCSEACRSAFRHEPQKFTSETAEGKAPPYSKVPDDWRS
ncbi:MAG: hypothetical protein A2038_11605 [Deltaproteobacteria bacterium GWA2_57_13]|nr:MAG: hypothetical protein A2038_11605 [Deltaproteobacteria bacterium GWA2_57_13]OGQ48913.1 MAG: hypothetical protein A3I10_06275 [Deltaproteobacteria bacterium RIFCSPLOWO2_02_FULL_57_26]OGQ76330.1 MAG: hypothetical protein A3G40_01980 [Deltaproteobacteria bacterium RIFCSPLOWO2_12_FULL_57_22]